MSVVQKTIRLIKRAGYAVLVVPALGFTWGFAEAVTNRYWPVYGVYRNHSFLSSLNDRAIFYTILALVIFVLTLAAVVIISRVFRSGDNWNAAFTTSVFAVVFAAATANVFFLFKSGMGVWHYLEVFANRLEPYVEDNLFPAYLIMTAVGVLLFPLLVAALKRPRWRRYLVVYSLAIVPVAAVLQVAELVKAASRPVPAELPDVYVITVDACRADYFTAENAPELTRYANEHCVIFTNARSPSSWTIPSFASFFSGLPPTACLSHRLVFGTERPTLAELLYENGYDTYFLTGNPILDRHRGLHRGFVNHAYWAYSPILTFLRFYDTNMYNPLTRKSDIETDPGVVNEALEEKALSIVRRDGPRPKFVWVHYMDPHWPYNPLPEYVNEAYVKYATDSEFYSSTRHGRKLKYNRIYKELYSAEIRMLDDDVKLLLDEIDKTGEALIIFTSDHGEEFFEHGKPSHGFTYYEEVMRVPCFVKLPEGYAGVETPSVVADNVDLVNLAPTVLTVLGLEIPAGMSNESFIGEVPENRRDDTLFFGTRLRPRKYLYTAIRGHKKIILGPENFNGGGEYYDLYLDPYEIKPLAFDETAEEMRDSLVGWVEDTGKLRESLELPPGTPDDSDLRALGYVK
jgi:arylsulfatase A-like enzyme